MITESKVCGIWTLTMGLSSKARREGARKLSIANKDSLFPAKLFNKRASDWLPALVSVVLSSFLLMMVALMMYNLAGNLDNYRFEPQTARLDYDLLSSRIINSPTCLAWEESYVGLDSQVKTLPHAGIINYNKLIGGANLDSCLKDRAYSVSLKDLDGNIWTASASRGNTGTKAIEDMFFVNIYKSGESELHRGVLTIKL